MATIIYRPTSDISLGHSCNSGSNGYSLISESSADDDSTYIYHDITSINSSTLTSKFRLTTTDNLPDYARVSSCYLHVRARSTGSGSYSGTFKISTGSSNSLKLNTSYSDSSASTGMTAQVYASSELPTSFDVEVSTTGRLSNSKGNSYQLRITQIYVVITYEETHPVTYDSVGDAGTSDTSPKNQTVYAGDKIVYSATLLPNYEFVGWYRDPAYSSIQSAKNPWTINVSSSQPSGKFTFYAKTQLVIVPIITVGTPNKSIISDEKGYNECICEFTSDSELVQWEARATKSNVTPARGVGLLVEEGNTLAAGVSANIYVLDSELTDGDGDYVITVYGKSTSGHWSDGSYEAN